jgi:hypothetical protein
MTRKTTTRWLALAASLVILGCSDADTPVAPANHSAPEFSVASDAAHARHEQLKQQLDERKAYFKAQREAGKAEFRAARAEWKAWKEDWKEQHKQAKEAWKRAHPGEKGQSEPEVQLLRCEPKEYDADAAIIGPNGGSLHVGAHELVIPKGALDREELIVAEAPMTSLVDIRFAPEGLQFLTPAQLTLSYKGCFRPTQSDFLVAYLGQGREILELPPSVDDRTDDEVEADIGHFSRYAIAW